MATTETTHPEKPDIRQHERDSSSHISSNEEKGVQAPNPSAYPTRDEDYVVTFKTWIVVAILASAYGVSFWIVPAIAPIATQVATKLGNPAAAGWFTSLYTICNAIAFMICGANSDLFGRRWFLIGGNVLLLLGHLLCGFAQNSKWMRSTVLEIAKSNESSSNNDDCRVRDYRLWCRQRPACCLCFAGAPPEQVAPHLGYHR
jgi:Na+/melibiose symporter-like transporter